MYYSVGGYLVHYAKGSTQKHHKYLERIPLKNGSYRYVYDKPKDLISGHSWTRYGPTEDVHDIWALNRFRSTRSRNGPSSSTGHRKKDPDKKRTRVSERSSPAIVRLSPLQKVAERRKRGRAHAETHAPDADAYYQEVSLIQRSANNRNSSVGKTSENVTSQSSSRIHQVVEYIRGLLKTIRDWGTAQIDWASKKVQSTLLPVRNFMNSIIFGT